MSNVCYSPRGRLIDWSIPHTSRWTCPLSAPYDIIRDRFPQRLVTANHTTSGSMSRHLQSVFLASKITRTSHVFSDISWCNNTQKHRPKYSEAQTLTPWSGLLCTFWLSILTLALTSPLTSWLLWPLHSDLQFSCSSSSSSWSSRPQVRWAHRDQRQPGASHRGNQRGRAVAADRQLWEDGDRHHAGEGHPAGTDPVTPRPPPSTWPRPVTPGPTPVPDPAQWPHPVTPPSAPRPPSSHPTYLTPPADPAHWPHINMTPAPCVLTSYTVGLPLEFVSVWIKLFIVWLVFPLKMSPLPRLCETTLVEIRNLNKVWLNARV